jgi:hypothetical protein
MGSVLIARQKLRKIDMATQPLLKQLYWSIAKLKDI